MTQQVSPAPWRRRFILMAAVALGAVASVSLHTGFSGSGPAYAQAPATVPAAPLAPGEPPTPTKPKAARPPADGASVAAPAHPPSIPSPSAKAAATSLAADGKAAPAPATDESQPASAAGNNDDADDDSDSVKPTPRKRHHGPTIGVTVDDDDKVHVSGMGAADGRYDSFEDFAHSAPWLAGIAFLALTLTFLVPLAVIVLLIWYKVHKNRMLNETMLKLAEKGVMPPAEAMASLGAAPQPATGVASPAAASLYDQARALRSQRTWSDLRRGIILGAVGLGLQAYSLFDSAEANWLGLTLMFLGCGYILLWFFEDRQRPLDPPRGGTGA